MDKKTDELSDFENNNYMFFEPKDIDIHFVDVINVHYNEERVILAFIQNLPGGLKIQDHDSQQFDGRVITQVAISWPHLIRLRDLLDKGITKYKDSVMSHLTSVMNNEISGGGEN